MPNKILLLLVILLVGSVALFGCTGGGGGCAGAGSIPQGWSGVAESDGTLFLGSMKGEVIALNASSGARLWSKVLETTKRATGIIGCAPASTTVAIYGTPAVSEDLVYVASYDGKIYAFSISSGALRWVYPREGHFDEPIVGSPVVALDKVYIGGSDGKVYALDAATGDLQWEFQTGDKIWSTPTIQGETLYIGSFDKKLYALSARDGSKYWEYLTEGSIASTPLIDDNTVYVGSFDRHVYAVDATTGKLIWQFPFTDEGENNPENWFWAKPVAYNNVIYAPCLDGKVYVLDAQTGDKINEFELESPISSSPVLVDSSIIIASDEGKVYVLDTGSNQPPRQLADLEEKLYASLGASDGVVYAHTQKHETLYALNAQTGVTLWSLPLSSK